MQSDCPLRNLRTALGEMQELTIAHVNLKEGPEVFNSWSNDCASIFTSSGVVYVCAVWEAFVEDTAEAAVFHLISCAASHEDIPLALKKAIAKELESDKHELAVWRLASDSWRELLDERLEGIVRKHTGYLNAPKVENVRKLFASVVGIESVVKAWAWEYFDNSSACAWLDRFVEARGAIAHGREPSFGIGSFALEFFSAFVKELACITHNEVRGCLLNAVGKEIWPLEKSTFDWGLFKYCAHSLPPLDEVMIHRTKNGQPHYCMSEKHIERIEELTRQG